ncbi:MAG: RbsD or FucU transport, partial [Firmicutes bacterium]|nr:RbsD or FucU transport [Bacillota bacterium]
KILIADANYPLSTCTNPAAKRVYLNLRPGVVGAADVVQVLAEAIPAEKLTVMIPDGGPDPEIFGDFLQAFPGLPLERVERLAFYRQALEPDLALAVQTGEQRLYANVLITIGVRKPAGAV